MSYTSRHRKRPWQKGPKHQKEPPLPGQQNSWALGNKEPLSLLSPIPCLSCHYCAKYLKSIEKAPILLWINVTRKWQNIRLCLCASPSSTDTNWNHYEYTHQHVYQPPTSNKIPTTWHWVFSIKWNARLRDRSNQVLTSSSNLCCNTPH